MSKSKQFIRSDNSAGINKLRPQPAGFRPRPWQTLAVALLFSRHRNAATGREKDKSEWESFDRREIKKGLLRPNSPTASAYPGRRSPDSKSSRTFGEFHSRPS